MKRLPSWILYPTLLVVLLAVLLISVIVATGLGATAIAPAHVLQSLSGHFLQGLPLSSLHLSSLHLPSLNNTQDSVIWLIRLPRVLLAGIVGATLAIVGAALQAVTANRLADPHLLGVSAGATLGAVTATLFLGALLGPFTLSALAFAGAMIATVLVMMLAHHHGRLDANRLLLSGVAVSFVMLAAANLLLYLGDQRAAASILFWSLGGVGGARWDMLPIPAAMALGGGIVLLARRRALDALLTGDMTAVSLGLTLGRVRREVFLLSALMTSAMVAVSGAIGFVGLLTPHLCRMLTGAAHGRLLPLSALLGAILLIWADVAARVWLAPEDLPIGVLTSLIGGVGFIVLMRFERRRDE